MKTFAIILLTASMTACYMSKSLDREVHVTVDPNIPISIFNEGNSNFTGANDKQTYSSNFVEGMNSEFTTSKIIPDGVSPEFNIQISAFNITESTSTKTIDDTTSDEHGNVYELTSFEYSANGTVTRTSNNVAYTWSASKSDNEKVKSNRTVIQLATGGNKERNVYREKELSSNDAANLAVNMGRRAGNSIVKEIMRALK